MHAGRNSVAVICPHRCRASAHHGQKNDRAKNRKQNGSHKIIFLLVSLSIAIEQRAECLSRKLLKRLRWESARQFATADFAALGYGNIGDEKDLFRDLPTAQPAPAKFQKLRFVYVG